MMHLRKYFLPAALLFAIALVTFSSNLRNGWIEDDHYMIEKNPYIQSLSFVPYIFSVQSWAATAWSSRGSGVYRPVPMALYMLDYFVFNLHPWGSHLLNDIVHALNVVLLFLLMVRFMPMRMAFFASCVFGVHPIVVETVSWVAARIDLLATFFIFTWINLALDMFWQKENVSWKRNLGLFLCCVLGPLTKETFILLPPMVLAIFFYQNFRSKKPQKNLVISSAVCMSAIFGCLALRNYVLQSHTASLLAPIVLENMRVFSLRLLEVLFLPMRSDAFFLYQPGPALSAYNIMFFASFVCLLSALLIRFRSQVDIALGAAIFIAGWLPAVLIIDLGNNIPERYYYLAFSGLLFVGASLLARMYCDSNRVKRLLKACAASWVLLLIALTIIHNQAWKDEVSLYRRSAEMNPASFFPYEKLMTHYMYLGDTPGMVSSCENVLQRKSTHAWCLNVLAVDKIDRKLFQEAKQLLRQALAADPSRSQTSYNVGYLYEVTGKLEDAEKWYTQAIQLNRKNTKAIQALQRMHGK